MSDPRTEFVRESIDAIGRLNDGLVDLERGEGDVDALFRVAHTLKGNCGAEGHDRAALAAHALEDLLSAVRGGDVDPTPETVDAALAAVDALDDAVRDVERYGEVRSDPDDAVRQVRARLVAAGLTPDVPDPDADPEPEPEPEAGSPADDGDDGGDAGGLDIDELAPDPADEDLSAEEALERASVFDDLESLTEEVDDAEEFAGLEGSGSFDELVDADSDSGGDGPGGADVDDTGRADEEPTAGPAVEADATRDPTGAEQSGDAGEDPLADLAVGADAGSETSGVGTDAGVDAGAGPGVDNGGDATASEEPSGTPDDPTEEFQQLRSSVDRADPEQLQSELEEVSFGEFDEDDDMEIQELVDLEPSGASGTAEAADGEAADPGAGVDDAATEPDETADPGATAGGSPDRDHGSEGVEPAFDPAAGTTADAGDPTTAGESTVEAGGPAPTDDGATGSTDEPAADPASEEPTTDAGSDGATGSASADGASADAGGGDDGATSVVSAIQSLSVGDDGGDEGGEDAGTDRDSGSDEAVVEEGETGDESDLEFEFDDAFDDGEPATVETDDRSTAGADRATAGGDPAGAGTDSPASADETGATGTDDVSGSPVEADAATGGADATDATDATDSADVEAGGAVDDADEAFDEALDAEEALSAAPVDGLDEATEPDPEFGVDDRDSGSDSDSDPEFDDDLGGDLDEEFGDVGDVDAGADAGDGFAFESGGETDDLTERFGDEFGVDDRDEEATVATTIPAAEGEPDRGRVERPTAGTVTVDAEDADDLLTLTERLITAQTELDRVYDGEDRDVRDALAELREVASEMEETVTSVRLTPIEGATSGLRRVVRDAVRNVEADKRVALETEGTDVELDRAIVGALNDPLVHLVRNAVAHGIEPVDRREAVDKPAEGTVTVRADRTGDRATVEVTDDGRGIDADEIRATAVERGVVDEREAAALEDSAAYELMFEPGFSTAEEVTDVSGRGVGLDVVQRVAREYGGDVEVESTPGEGTTVRMTLPVSVAVAEMLFVEVGEERYALPADVVDRVEVAADGHVEGGEYVTTVRETGPATESVGEDLPPGATHFSDAGDAGDPGIDDGIGGDPEVGAGIGGGSDAGVNLGSDVGEGGGGGAVAVEEPTEQERYPLVDLGEALGVSGRSSGPGVVVVVRDEVRRVAIRCDAIGQWQTVVVSPYEQLFGDVPGIDGATVLGDGEVVNVIDVESLGRES